MTTSLYISACLLAFLKITVHSTYIGSFSGGEITIAPGDEVLGNNTNGTLSGFQTTDYAIVDFAKLGYELFKDKLFDALAMLDTFMEMKPMVLKITRTFIFGNATDTTNKTNLTINKINETSSELQDEQYQSEIATLTETNTESPLTNIEPFQSIISKPIEANSETPVNNKDSKSSLQTMISKPIETDTEFPLTYKDSASWQQTNEILHSTEFTNSLDKNKIKQPYEDNTDQMYNDETDVQKRKVEDEGVFGRVIGAVGNVFKSVWNWLTG